MGKSCLAPYNEVSQIPEARENMRGWLLYDGRCPICRRGVRRLGGIIRRRGYRLAPLQRRWVQERLAARREELPDAMFLLLPDGRLLAGADAYLFLCRRVWWATPLALLGALPGMRAVLRRLYAWVARNRFAISRTCGLNQCR
ncbi:MAG: thiol-disulfide oxidoreductase DCC family protein [Planctomycetota bacterium]|jgi:predicted DCC family thiol-disulfide oxidoreductase YuxK